MAPPRRLATKLSSARVRAAGSIKAVRFPLVAASTARFAASRTPSRGSSAPMVRITRADILDSPGVRSLGLAAPEKLTAARLVRRAALLLHPRQCSARAVLTIPASSNRSQYATLRAPRQGERKMEGQRDAWAFYTSSGRRPEATPGRWRRWGACGRRLRSGRRRARGGLRDRSACRRGRFAAPPPPLYRDSLSPAARPAAPAWPRHAAGLSAFARRTEAPPALVLRRKGPTVVSNLSTWWHVYPSRFELESERR